VDNGTSRRAPDRVLYLVVSGAPAPEGVPALITACQAADWQVVAFSTPTGTSFIDPAELEQLTGGPVRSEYRMPGTGMPVPPAGAAGASTEHEEADRQLSLGYLRAKARSAYQAYQATRYHTTGRILPGLILGVETAAHSVGAASPDACGVRVLVYDTTAALLSRVGEPFLA
jgi:hypothetical protein